MPSCPNRDRCALTQSIGTEAALRVWRSFYCDGIHVRCERYKLAAAGAEVPPRLLPNGRLLDAPEGQPGTASLSDSSFTPKR
jgi:hypothetical protein